MLMGSAFIDRKFSEAIYFKFKDQTNLHNNDSGLALSGRETSVVDKEETTIRVSDGPASERSNCSEVSFELDQEAFSPKPTVCTLLYDQYLPCGIGCRLHTESPRLYSYKHAEI